MKNLNKANRFKASLLLFIAFSILLNIGLSMQVDSLKKRELQAVCDAQVVEVEQQQLRNQISKLQAQVYELENQ